jgi:hypothetical protein
VTTAGEMSCLDCGKPRGSHKVFTGYCDRCAARHSARLSELNRQMSGAFFGAMAERKPKETDCKHGRSGPSCYRCRNETRAAERAAARRTK